MPITRHWLGFRYCHFTTYRFELADATSSDRSPPDTSLRAGRRRMDVILPGSRPAMNRLIGVRRYSSATGRLTSSHRPIFHFINTAIGVWISFLLPLFSFHLVITIAYR